MQPVVNSEILFDDEFEVLRNTMKEEAQKALEKASSQAKDALKGQTDISATTITPYMTSPSELVVNETSPATLAPVVNTAINSSVETVSKKASHEAVDRSVDTTAKKAIDQSVDYSVNSTKSYFSMACDYIINIVKSS